MAHPEEGGFKAEASPPPPKKTYIFNIKLYIYTAYRHKYSITTMNDDGFFITNFIIMLVTHEYVQL